MEKTSKQYSWATKEANDKILKEDFYFADIAEVCTRTGVSRPTARKQIRELRYISLPRGVYDKNDLMRWIIEQS